jgi:hypothetical protein
VATAKRRRFSASEKRRLPTEAERCEKPAVLGAFMRRERLYSSMLSSRRKQRDQAAERDGGAAARQIPPGPERERIAQLKRKQTGLERELFKALRIIDVQKNAGNYRFDPRRYRAAATC